MTKYGIGLASGLALALAAAAGPSSASMASPVQVNGTAHRAAPASGRSAAVAWVVNQSVPSLRKGSVTPVDTATNTVIKSIPISGNPLAVALAPDGKTAYVAVQSVNGTGSPRGSVIPVSASTYRVGAHIKVGVTPSPL